MLNLSLNETLSRTMMTIFTVLIAVVALLVFGGPVTFGFALATTLGLIVGTYSSIWVASAIVLWLGVKRDWGTKGDSKAGTQFGRQGLRAGCARPRSTSRAGCRSTATAPGGFRVAGAVHRGPLALVPEGIVAWDGLPDLGPFLERVAELRRSAGRARARSWTAAGGLRRGAAALEAAGAGVDVMATPSACRTYNVLLAEGRRVAAALMPV